MGKAISGLVLKQDVRGKLPMSETVPPYFCHSCNEFKESYHRRDLPYFECPDSECRRRSHSHTGNMVAVRESDESRSDRDVYVIGYDDAKEQAAE